MALVKNSSYLNGTAGAGPARREASLFIQGILERKPDALALLKKAKEVGFPYLDWAARGPDLACLHDDPEFQRLIAQGLQKP